MKEPLISIIVPIYNVEQYLEKCVNSLIIQTYKNLEIILVDDGSPDRCPEICDNLAKQDKRIQVIHKENGGVTSAWIEGFKFSAGKYVTFVDPDDYVENSYIETQIISLLNADADLSICGYYVVFENKTIIKNSHSDDFEGVLEGEKLELFKKNTVNQINYYTPFYKWNKLFKREIVEKNLMYSSLEVSLGDDCCISLSSILDAKKIVFINQPLYFYIQRKSSIIHAYNTTLIHQMTILLDNLKNLMNDKGYLTEESIIFEEARMLFIISRNFLISSLTKKEKKVIFYQLQKSEFANHLKLQKNIKFLPKTYKIFVKIFLTGNYTLTNLGIKAFKFIKKLKQKLK